MDIGVRIGRPVGTGGRVRPRATALLREPVLHFVLAGALLFAADAWLRGGEADAPPVSTTIRVGAADVAWIAGLWQQQAGRRPDEAELRGLVAAYVREEALAREARARGLEDGDTVIRRRLVQKLEFLLADTTRLPEPAEADLRAFHASNAARYAEPGRFTFRQLFFSAERRADAAADAAAALALIREDDAAAASLGDATLLDAELRSVDTAAVARQFGDGFATALGGFAPGMWQGPVASPYGLHLVRVDAVEPGRPLAFEAVRERVLADWRAAGERRIHAAQVAEILGRYRVIAEESVRPLVEAARPLAGPVP